VTGEVSSSRKLPPRSARASTHGKSPLSTAWDLLKPQNRAVTQALQSRFASSQTTVITTSLATAVLMLANPGAAGATAALSSRSLPQVSSPVRPVAIFEPDDRRLISDQYAQVRKRIGLLVHRRTKSVCTAFCVAPDIVATAGHCVAGTLAQPAGDPADLRFRRDRPRVPGIAIKGAEDGTLYNHIVTGAGQLNTRPPINAASDWVFLRLAQKACPSGGLPLSRRTSSQVAADAADGRIYNLAYHRDLPHWKLAVARPCGFISRWKTGEREQLSRDFEHSEDLLLHTCDTEAASSGSPLIVDGKNGPEVVGINVGTYVRSRVVTQDGQVIQHLDTQVIANTALLASPLVAPLEAFANGQLLTNASQIEQLQNLLLAQGLQPGPCDGHYGPQTRTAIETYEARVGLPITGLATRSLLSRLETTTSARAQR